MPAWVVLVAILLATLLVAGLFAWLLMIRRRTRSRRERFGLGPTLGSDDRPAPPPPRRGH